MTEGACVCVHRISVLVGYPFKTFLLNRTSKNPVRDVFAFVNFLACLINFNQTLMKNLFWVIALSALTLSSAHAPAKTEEHCVDECFALSEMNLHLNMLTDIGPMTFSEDYFLWAPANVYAEVPHVAGAGYYDYQWYLDGVFQQWSGRNHEFTFYGCGSHYLSVRALTSSGWTDFAHGYFYVASC